MRKRALVRFCAPATFLVLATQGLAGDPTAIDLGGVSFIPEVRVAEVYDDNIRETGFDEQSSWVTTIEPSFTLLSRDRSNYYQLQYVANSQTFHSSRDDDNTDHHLSAISHMELSSRNRFDFMAGYNRVEDIQDTTDVTENDKFHAYNVGGVYGIGLEDAVVHLDLGVNHEWKRYDNAGSLNEDRERDTLSFNAIVYYRIAPKTEALIEARQHEYDYELNSSPLNSTSNQYLVGLEWDATAKTTGSVKVGYEEKDFDSSALGDHEDPTWEAGVTWRPRTYSTLVLNARRGTDEGSVTEDFIETTRTSLAWNHQWNHKVTTDLSYTFLDEDYTNQINRQDETSDASLSLNYEFRRWFTFGLGYTYRDRDSNVPIRDFDRNIFMLKGVISL